MKSQLKTTRRIEALTLIIPVLWIGAGVVSAGYFMMRASGSLPQIDILPMAIIAFLFFVRRLEDILDPYISAQFDVASQDEHS